MHQKDVIGRISIYPNMMYFVQASMGGQDLGPGSEPEPEIFNHRKRGSCERRQGVYVKREGDSFHRRPSDRDRCL